MSVIGSNILAGASGQGGDYTIARSLRFRSSASAYLNRTPASAGNRRTFTFSAWMKRGRLANANKFFATIEFASGVNRQFNLSTSSSGQLEVNSYADSGFNFRLVTTQVFRDPSAWYHFVVAIDTTQATDTNRVKVYVNGTQITTFSTANYPTQNLDTYMNQAKPMGIGAEYGLRDGSPDLFTGGGYYDGYLTEVNFIDGQALTPSSFGANNASTGVWQPKKYAGTYGTNGFYLPFTDNSGQTTSSNVGLGKDFSGNGNYWTTNNISITAGSTYDSMTDVPTNTSATQANYCVLNPLFTTSTYGTFSNGNLTLVTPSTGVGISRGTMEIPQTGKWYWEFTPTVNGGESYSGIDGGTGVGVFYYAFNGWKYVDAIAGAAYGATYTTNDVIGVAVNSDAGEVTFYKNGVSQGVITYSVTGKSLFPAFQDASSVSVTFQANFGQRPFAYTPPTGFVALNTFNLPTPTIGATASTQANKNFNIVTYTGDQTTGRAITGVGFQPDFVWAKARNNAQNHTLYNSVVGATKYLGSNTTSAESTNSETLQSFDSDGFTLGNAFTNETAYTYVAWNWKANGTGVTNTAGSITSTVSANTSSGFSVVTYTGTGSNATVGHGLGVAPKMMIIKQRNTTNDWPVYHTSLGNGGVVWLNQTSAFSAGSAWNSTTPTSTVFSIGNNSYTNINGGTFVAYCFSDVQGYQKCGSYVGNGSADGTFIHTGFRPKFVIIRSTSNLREWFIIDSSRSTYNVANTYLRANTSSAEGTDTVNDLLSNGFKLRNGDSAFNGSGETYIYYAVAETPAKFSLAR